MGFKFQVQLEDGMIMLFRFFDFGSVHYELFPVMLPPRCHGPDLCWDRTVRVTLSLGPLTLSDTVIRGPGPNLLAAAAHAFALPTKLRPNRRRDTPLPLLLRSGAPRAVLRVPTPGAAAPA